MVFPFPRLTAGMYRELSINGVYRVPAASLAKQNAGSSEGSPDVQAIYTGECVK